MKKVIIIGAGPAGIIAALRLCENFDVTLLDKNDKVGRKILLTGNGKCNYWNENIVPSNYYTDNYDTLEKILSFKEETFKFLSKLGIYPKIKNGYYYPASQESSSIREIFERELKRKNIIVKYNYDVKSIKKENDKFLINDELSCDKLIIASGGMAAPKTGSDGSVYKLLEKFDLHQNTVLPALTSLNVLDNPLKNASGVRCDVTLNLYIDRHLSSSEDGELQITDYGLSGICVFNLSSLVSKSLLLEKRVDMKINFVPFITDLQTFFTSKCDLTIKESLESVLSYKLLPIILKRSKVKDDDYYEDLSDSRKECLLNNLLEFEVNISSTNDYDKSQVTTGGISLNDIDPRTMESKIKNLYFAGEVLDTDGKCGGFNLAFAFITGYITGGIDD